MAAVWCVCAKVRYRCSPSCAAVLTTATTVSERGRRAPRSPTAKSTEAADAPGRQGTGPSATRWCALTPSTVPTTANTAARRTGRGAWCDDVRSGVMARPSSDISRPARGRDPQRGGSSGFPPADAGSRGGMPYAHRGLADLGHHEPDMLADLVPDRTGSTAARAVGLAVIGVGLAAGLHHATTDSSLSWPALALAAGVPGKRRGRRWAGWRSGQCELPGSAAEW